MNEDSVRGLLDTLAHDPEPLVTSIDVDAARRRGRRRQRVLRAAVPAAALTAAVVAVGVIVTVPHAFSPTTERPVPPVAPASPSAATGTAPRSAPAGFNPLVPYADFGWLPSGFTQGAGSGAFGFSFTSDPTTVDRAALSVPAGHTLRLTVSARGACPGTAGRGLAATSVRPVQVSCGNDGLNRFLETGPALEVNGRPAVYIGDGDGIAWEYAPGAWASVVAGVTASASPPTALGKPAGVPQLSGQDIARRRGWVLTPASALVADKLRSDTTLEVVAAIKDGLLIPPSAATEALLAKVAAHVRFGATKPVYSAFRLSGALPAGWQLTSVSFQVSGSALVSDGVSAGPAADTSALSVGASWPAGYDCGNAVGKSFFVTRYGVSWVLGITGKAGRQVQTICSTGKPTVGPTGLPDGLQVSISLDLTIPGSSAALPGSAELGGPFGVYARMILLGTDPGGWTTRPLG